MMPRYVTSKVPKGVALPSLRGCLAMSSSLFPCFVASRVKKIGMSASEHTLSSCAVCAVRMRQRIFALMPPTQGGSAQQGQVRES